MARNDEGKEMKYRASRLALVLMVCIFSIARGGAVPKSGYTITGYISAPARVQSAQSFKAKLSFPGGEQVLFAKADAFNIFSFSGLHANSYFLEVFLNDVLYYQKEIKSLESDLLLAIPVGNLKLVSQITIPEKKSAALKDLDPQGRLILEVGDISSDLRPNSGRFLLKILTGARPTSVWLVPPKLITNFLFNNQRYTLTGTVRRSGATEFLDCEIYR